MSGPQRFLSQGWATQWQILNISKDIDIFLFNPLPDIALHRYSKFLEGELFSFSRVGLLPVAMTLPEE